MSEVSFDLGRYSLSQSKPSAYDFCEDGAAFVATRYGKGQFGILFGYKETFSQTEHEHQRFVARGGSGKKRKESGRMWALKKILVPTRTFRPDGMGLNFRNDYDLSALTEHELEEMRLSEKQTEQVVIGQEHSWYVPPRIEGRNNLLLDPAKIKELAEEQFWNPDAVGGYIEDRVEAYTGGEGYVREAFLHTGEAFSILVKKTLFTHMPREHQKAVENACIAYSEDPQPLLERLILDTHSNAVEDIMRAIRNVMILNSKDEVNWQAVRTYCMGE